MVNKAPAPEVTIQEAWDAASVKERGYIAHISGVSATVAERKTWRELTPKQKTLIIRRGVIPKAVPKAKAGNPGIIYGWLTPPLMEELKKLIEATEWPPPEEPSPTFSTVLQVCDYAFTLKVLKRKTYEMNVGKSGHKKILIARLLNVEEEEVTDIAQRTIAELEARGNEDRERTLDEVTEIARKVVGA